MREELHWLPFPQRILYRISSLACRCLTGWASCYLRELFRRLSTCALFRPPYITVLSVHGDLVVTFARSATMQSSFYSVVGSTTWNKLPSHRRSLPNGTSSQFHQLLKTFLIRLGRER